MHVVYVASNDDVICGQFIGEGITDMEENGERTNVCRSYPTIARYLGGVHVWSGCVVNTKLVN